MDLDAQIAELLHNAPDDTAARAIQLAAPVFKSLAQQLGHLEYFVVQSPEEAWIVTTLSSRHQPEKQKTVVYAYPTEQDAATGIQGLESDPLVARKQGVIDILFQLLALNVVNALVFFDTPGDVNRGTEIKRADLKHLIDLQLQQGSAAKGFSPRPNPGKRNKRERNSIPPNFA
ncbi:hypothetical protein [Leptolyngbya sp. FACHB-261]|uniref:hypothetical protein n=1 Tax=Leptolyngbya sp. FACHB-261 TaxID=2692806 RepID=UPI0016868239|nr:hypothetical protein [Leptolyngbya sp. FACHB-261]MBD2104735.1 hypothetical protein [Leptolyngbya sp. FACHB-261]